MTDYPREVDGYVEVIKRFRLWSDVPAEERQDLTTRSPGFIRPSDRELGLGLNPKCKVALYHETSMGVAAGWWPCKNPVQEGHDLCRFHGGSPRVPRQSYAQVAAERDRLRAEIDLLLKDLAEWLAQKEGNR